MVPEAGTIVPMMWFFELFYVLASLYACGDGGERSRFAL